MQNNDRIGTYCNQCGNIMCVCNRSGATKTSTTVNLNTMPDIGQAISPINWIPRTKCVLVTDDELNNKDKQRLASLGLIDPNSLSDNERIMFGGTSKSADVANKTSEEQRPFIIVATGEQCTYKPGDVVIFAPGCQANSIKVDDKYYLQLNEYEILGKFKS